MASRASVFFGGLVKQRSWWFGNFLFKAVHRRLPASPTTLQAQGSPRAGHCPVALPSRFALSLFALGYNTLQSSSATSSPYGFALAQVSPPPPIKPLDFFTPKFWRTTAKATRPARFGTDLLERTGGVIKIVSMRVNLHTSTLLLDLEVQHALPGT